MVHKILSGGQTGADRAALDFAIAYNIPHGGWCPQGRKAEDGIINSCYNVTETPSGDYSQRTQWNVRDSDGTVVFTVSQKLSGGSLETIEFAKQMSKPCIHISQEGNSQHGNMLRDFIKQHSITVLNVAGSRGGKEPGVGVFVLKVMRSVLY